MAHSHTEYKKQCRSTCRAWSSVCRDMPGMSSSVSFTSNRHWRSRCADPLLCALMTTNESFSSSDSVRVLSILLPSFLRPLVIKTSLAICASPESLAPLQMYCDVNSQHAWIKNRPCPFLLERFGKFPWKSCIHWTSFFNSEGLFFQTLPNLLVMPLTCVIRDLLRLEISSRKSEIPREYFMQRRAQ